MSHLFLPLKFLSERIPQIGKRKIKGKKSPVSYTFTANLQLQVIKLKASKTLIGFMYSAAKAETECRGEHDYFMV